MAQVLAILASKRLTDAQVGSPANLWPSSSRDVFRWGGAAGQVLLAVLGLEAAAGLLGVHGQQRCLHPVPTQGSHDETLQPGHTLTACASLPTLSHFYFLQSFVL